MSEPKPVAIEFYNADAADPNRALVTAVDAHVVPEVGEMISIRGVTYEVVRRTWCVDYADDTARRKLRANIDLAQPGDAET